MDDRDMVAALTPDQRHEALANLPAWSFDEAKSALYRCVDFDDFAQAFGVMTRIAIAAEKAGHHPEWLNVYNRLHIWLTTHDAGNSVSVRDIDLASMIDRFLPT
jgi:4a-hydroxytetrahydrobiopterin dehydratase